MAVSRCLRLQLQASDLPRNANGKTLSLLLRDGQMLDMSDMSCPL